MSATERCEACSHPLEPNPSPFGTPTRTICETCADDDDVDLDADMDGVTKAPRAEGGRPL